MNKKMSSEELRECIEDFMLEHRSASLATCKDNIPRSSPVQYFMGKDLSVFIVSAGGEKFDAIRTNPNVCLLVNTEYINYRKIKGVQVFGKATTNIEVPEIFEEAKAYCPEPFLMEHEGNRLKVIKIIPQKIVYLDSLEDGDRTKQILDLQENQVQIKEDVLELAKL
ncbi:MAG: pyridoxamine 5'-phosphate oxidase family protein [Epulopiscium sp.]|nr:pyridoxamine 5'-phosphate oxidase family protein [Candidatus Epulonipiscium sp.]